MVISKKNKGSLNSDGAPPLHGTHSIELHQTRRSYYLLLSLLRRSRWDGKTASTTKYKVNWRSEALVPQGRHYPLFLCISIAPLAITGSMYNMMSFFLRISFIIFNCVHLCVAIAHECRCPRSLEEDIGSPGAGASGSCKLLHMGAGSWTWVLDRSPKRS